MEPYLSLRRPSLSKSHRYIITSFLVHPITTPFPFHLRSPLHTPLTTSASRLTHPCCFLHQSIGNPSPVLFTELIAVAFVIFSHRILYRTLHRIFHRALNVPFVVPSLRPTLRNAGDGPPFRSGVEWAIPPAMPHRTLAGEKPSFHGPVQGAFPPAFRKLSLHKQSLSRALNVPFVASSLRPTLRSAGDEPPFCGGVEGTIPPAMPPETIAGEKSSSCAPVRGAFLPAFRKLCLVRKFHSPLTALILRSCLKYSSEDYRIEQTLCLTLQASLFRGQYQGKLS